MLIGRLRLPAWAVDLLLAVPVAAVALAAEYVTAAGQGRAVPGHSVALLMAGALALAVITRLPLPAAVVIGTVNPLYYMLGQVDSWAASIAFPIGVIRLGATGHRAAAVTATVLFMGTIAVGESIRFELWRALSTLGGALVVLLAGEIARSNRAYLHEVQRRAAEAERTREEEGRRRATEERLRIARELHDVVAHHISLINVQAGAAAYRRDDPDGAYAALDAIKAASREALRELRTTLGVLRQVDGGPEPAAPTAPAPTLARVGELAEHTTRAGLPVDLRVEGDPVPLPAAVDLAAYRIVQEALTNALRHSGAARAAVSVAYRADGVSVRVEDDGRAAGPVAEGNGLRGMRERAAAVGGTVRAAPRAGAPGFAVQADLPLAPGAGGAGTTAG
ncbi:sensor histidine kinase [Streptomonospora nanhaiensis]|uniref:sensor histidine kinase n=1 Tax=Streptomonospora nanhaiensis TaxID=1323731 RepID=UPI001C3904EF|nr:histidine kinase [Streptomonospora nanhaiensis]MBV2365158.1 sensor histidine kinase [Streptomonospora nanhaiensis]MBV2366337.1 sensor histidine kinase [Streptomonospora nanhaiensis]MBX9391758.1 sensor histidine kinase [Streptomonospora nanhaiensis]